MKARKESSSETRTPVPPKPVAKGKPESQQVYRSASNGNGQVNVHDASALLHEFLEGLLAMRAGDFSARMATDHVGLAGKIADTFNDIISANERMAQQLERVGEAVGREGKTRNRVKFALTGDAWGDMENSVNTLIEDLLWP